MSLAKKKCPVCKGDTRIQKTDEGYRVKCRSCGSDLGKTYKTKLNAVSAWNFAQVKVKVVS